MPKLLNQGALAALCVAAPSWAASQEAAPPSVVEAEQQPVKLPALTLVELVVREEVSSKTAVNGQPVKLALSKPLYVTPELGLPAGTPVEGVVIHAAKGGMAGKSGELLLGAKRIVLSDGTAIPLRSFKLGPAEGRNNETLALVTAAAVGLPALFISGGSAVVHANMVAHAKTSAEVDIPASGLTKLPPLAAVAAPTTRISTEGESK